MKKNLLLSVATALFSVAGFSQTISPWKLNLDDNISIVKEKAVARLSFPKNFKKFDLNVAPVQSALLSIVDNVNNNHSVIITVPNAEGSLEQFEVMEASNFEPDLQAKFPQIRAYSGSGITDRASTIKLSLSPQGIQTMVFRTGGESEFIEPYSEDKKIYAVYKSQRTNNNMPWACTTVDKGLVNGLNESVASFTSSTLSNNAVLKTMRLAQSCNGEYANFFGATSALDIAKVMAAYNATLTRCNGVYEKDLALHLNLISASTDVIFYNPATDPYSTTLSEWNIQLQETLTAVVGNDNYDIGHMFGASGGGGNAGCIGCVCINPTTADPMGKGSGITSPADGIPMGDNFDIDYVTHEIGHQLGGNHTFTHTPEFTIAQREVGSGITIMGYAGITNFDVADHSIEIFHGVTIEQIQTNLATKLCPITTSLALTNATPIIAPLQNFTIPILTPFQLTGSAIDANAQDVLTYCWEDYNDGTGQIAALSLALPTKVLGPNFISYPATTNPTRIFPRLESVLNGQFTTDQMKGDTLQFREALSAVGRILDFRLTVRDNSPYSSTPPIKVGQTAFADMSVTVNPLAGPFLITTQNLNEVYQSGSTQTITWLVAGTTTLLGAGNTPNVKISFSSDGGRTFPMVLAASTPNDGSQAVLMPNIQTTTARVKVEAIGNIFLDINNTNFTLASVLPVKYNSFTAVKNNRTVALNWAVNNEINANTYKIERSKDGINFIEIDNKAAKLNNNATGNNYNAIDAAPFNGDNYYRIALVDKDGKVTYSETKKVNFNFQKMPTIVYPISGILQIDLPSIDKPYSFTIHNAAGQKIMENTKVNQAQFKINMQNFAKGIFVLNINYDNERYSFKVVNQQ